MTKPSLWFLAVALTAATAAPAFADRAPTPEELWRIERSLARAGYAAWEAIELDDGRWAVDGAVGQDGRPYDVRLDPVTLRIVAAEPL
jgi:hypothetical protein